MQDKVQQLKEEVRVQYHKMHQLLEDDLGRTLEVLDKAHTKYCQENSTQTLQLNARRQEAKKLLSSVQVVFDKAENINIMKVRSIHSFTLHRCIHLVIFYGLWYPSPVCGFGCGWGLLIHYSIVFNVWFHV